MHVLYLVDPQAFKCVLVGYGGGYTEEDSLDDPGKVPQVEEVVRLGWGGQEAAHGRFVHVHGGCHNLRTQSYVYQHFLNALSMNAVIEEGKMIAKHSLFTSLLTHNWRLQIGSVETLGEYQENLASV